MLLWWHWWTSTCRARAHTQVFTGTSAFLSFLYFIFHFYILSFSAHTFNRMTQILWLFGHLLICLHPQIKDKSEKTIVVIFRVNGVLNKFWGVFERVDAHEWWKMGIGCVCFTEGRERWRTEHVFRRAWDTHDIIRTGVVCCCHP